MSVPPTTNATLVNAATSDGSQELADRGIFTTDASLVIRSWNQLARGPRPAGRAPRSSAVRCGICPDFARAGSIGTTRRPGAARSASSPSAFTGTCFRSAAAFHSAGITEMAQSARIAPLRDGDAVIGTITVIEDVTERVMSERELRNQIASSEQARASPKRHRA